MISLTTPARVCLFGDHQDYLGLPIIACAINRYMTIEATPNSNDYFEIDLPDIKIHRKIFFEDHILKPLPPSDFFLSGMRVAQRMGCQPFHGYRISLKSSIPINAGVSSSSALVVSWMHFLLKTFGDESPSPLDIAQGAYEAEVLEHQGPGGKMDQYTIALGNILYLETGRELIYQQFKKPLPGMILVESGIPKETLDTLSNVRGNTQRSVELIKLKHKDFLLDICDNSKARELVDELPKPIQEYFLAAVENHEITKQALALFRNPIWDVKKLGELMYQHHSILRDRLGVSHPIIDQFIKTAMESGAYGGKIVGSGGGGCAIILTHPDKTDEIIHLLIEVGAKAAYEIEVSQGTHVTQ